MTPHRHRGDRVHLGTAGVGMTGRVIVAPTLMAADYWARVLNRPPVSIWDRHLTVLLAGDLHSLDRVAGLPAVAGEPALCIAGPPMSAEDSARRDDILEALAVRGYTISHIAIS